MICEEADRYEVNDIRLQSPMSQLLYPSMYSTRECTGQKSAIIIIQVCKMLEDLKDVSSCLA